ncbi:MAG: right-handed parallel beta-helix repeat-containing protein, partial [Anaerolineae bacterium]|nr:right-handed parallel beta-helix repeat-containing protein [Anaerolineae bacterium]
SGAGSLRQAIIDAKHAPGADTITFAINPGGIPVLEHKINITAALPTITDTLTIQGPNSNGAPIALDGNGGDYNGLWITADGCTIRGLTIRNFGQNGIFVQGASGTLIAGNRIGSFGTLIGATGNGGDGISLINTISTVIGGTTTAARNVISGNGDYGISIYNGGTNAVRGNFIGTNATGTSGQGNGKGGVYLGGSGAGNTIGGTSAAARNLISGHNGERIPGIYIASDGNFVSGNYIGTNISGTQAISNSVGIWIQDASYNTIGGITTGSGNLISGNGDGIRIQSSTDLIPADDNVISGNFIGTDVSGTTAVPNRKGIIISGGARNTIGGTTSSARNLISGNGDYGIYLTNSNTISTVIQGNTIGANLAVTQPLANGGHGIHIERALNTQVGGGSTGAGNVIAGNVGSGLYVQGDANDYSYPHNTLIQGNAIGTNAAGTLALPNQAAGITLRRFSVIVGGTAAGVANTIAHNGGPGVLVASYFDSSVRANSIHSNAGLGIDLGSDLAPDGVTPNDPGDMDTSVNRGQNYPLLTGVTVQDSQTIISGTLNSEPSKTYQVDFYRNAACDPTGYGEGQQYLGSRAVTTDANGDAAFSVTLTTQIPGLFYVTATATHPEGSTSEFSPCLFYGRQVFLPLVVRQ